tara:strand:- start:4833 stop:5468 length:636 start_codon:yes stop_codon:yes gene_type:complete
MREETQRLKELFDSCGTDKATPHRYEHAYARFLAPYRELNPCYLLEIGIADCGSLRAWNRYFSWPKIHAIDNDWRSVDKAVEEVVKDKPDWISPVFGKVDQSDRQALSTFVGDQHFHIIIDDGSHRVDHQQISFEVLWPHLVQGGMYVIEDLESSKRNKEKWNPKDYTPTLDWLLETVKHAVPRSGKQDQPPITYAFSGGAVFIFKPVEVQ